MKVFFFGLGYCVQGVIRRTPSIGAGVGLGLIVNGRLVRGARGAAGEIAYLPICGDLESLDARAVGAFELEVGAAGILRRYIASGADPVESVRDLFSRLETGDALALKTIEATARTVALALTALGAIVDPELVVLGGSIGIRAELAERVRSALRSVFARPIDVRVSALGARAGLVGAVSLAVNRLHNDLFGMSGLPKELSVPGVVAGRAAA